MDTPDLSKLKIDRTTSAAGARPRLRRRWWKAVVTALVVLALALAVASRFERAARVETATAALAYPSQNYTLLNATGYVVAQRKAALSSKATGRLEWLGVLEGSPVKKGEIVARLENRDVAAALEQADANVKLARANLEQGAAEWRDAQRAYRRAQDLLRQKYVSQASVDTALARYDKAQAALAGLRAAIAAAEANRQAAKVALDQTLIRAPFDGVVLTKNANVGDNITPFSSAIDSKGAVVTIADMDTLEVEADVAESSLSKISVGQACEIQLDAFPGLRLAGVVSRLVPTVDRSKATLLAKVRFVERDPRVLPDMSAKVAFLSQPVPAAERKPAVAVLPAALAERGGRTVVFVVRDGKARQTPVAAGERIGELVAVRGIRAGEKVVLGPGANLKDGSAAAPVEK